MCQFLEEIDYHTAFKCLAEPFCTDALDTHYTCFWDTNILEYLIYLQTKRNNKDRAKKAVREQFLLLIALLDNHARLLMSSQKFLNGVCISHVIHIHSVKYVLHKK